MSTWLVVVIERPRRERSGRLLSRWARGVYGGDWFWRIVVLGGASLGSGSVLEHFRCILGRRDFVKVS